MWSTIICSTVCRKNLTSSTARAFTPEHNPADLHYSYADSLTLTNPPKPCSLQTNSSLNNLPVNCIAGDCFLVIEAKTDILVDLMTLTDNIKRKAVELGFDLVGITDASPLNAEQTQFLADWLKAGYAGQMSYMHRNFEKRINPSRLLENAQSVIVVGLNYKPPVQDLKPPNPIRPRWGKVAQYAQYEDYHPFIKKRLRKLSEHISSIAGKGVQFKICVDSAPVAERAFAVRAGLGFVGKNRMLISSALGPQIFLGEIITTLKLQPDKPIAADCCGCNKCIAACPTGALRADGRFDANKCINYLTIEYKGQIPADLAEKIKDRLFGCDDCVLACPHQQNAPPCKNSQFKFYSDRAELNVDEILSLSEESFKAGFADSVIKRLGLAGLKRNTQICLANITRSCRRTALSET